MRALSFYQKAMGDFSQFKAKCSAASEQKKKECDQRIDAAQRQLAVCNQEIGQINILHSSYWGYLSTIITLMETGRADTCKEALNIAIEQEDQRRHQERMEEIAREELENAKAAQERAKAAQQKQDKINDMLEEELRWKIHDRFYKK